MTVEEMAMHAGISRQTMYDYIKRWLDMDFISKTSYIGAEQKVIIGYKLNGPTLESAFDKSKTKILNNVDITAKYIGELQRILKNEKISKRFDEKRKDNEQQTLTPEKLETPTIEKKEEDVGAVLSQFF
jgi:DNA-binding transcriptional regulator GbsR (MarR family)